MQIIKIILAKSQYLLPHYLLSKLIFKLANSTNIYLKNKLIHLFIKKFKVDLNYADRKNTADYTSFNDFFTRKLDLLAANRMIANQAELISPADGTIAAIGKIEAHLLYQAKNKYYTLQSLMGENLVTSSYCQLFSNGSYVTIYLAPKDYHRLHMPCDGQLEQMIYIPGRLFSVNQTSCNNINNIFARNERIINIFKTNDGHMAVIMVGAMLVGSMATSWHGIITPPHGLNHSNTKIATWDYSNKNIKLNKSAELGYFQMGSTIIVLFSQNYNYNHKLLNTRIYYGTAL